METANNSVEIVNKWVETVNNNLETAVTAEQKLSIQYKLQIIN